MRTTLVDPIFKTGQMSGHLPASLKTTVRKQQTRKIGQFAPNTKQKVYLSLFSLIIVRL